MINKYNKSVDSIKSQELAIEKVKQKLDSIKNGEIVPQSLKEMDTQLNQNNKELEKVVNRINELQNKKLTTRLEDQELYKLKQAQTDLMQINAEIKEEMNNARGSSVEVQELTSKLELMNSKLSQSKEESSQLKEEIQDAFNQQHLSKFGTPLNEIGGKIDKFKNKMTRLISTVAIFSLLRSGLTSLRNNFVSLLKTNDGFNSSLNQVKANLMTAFAPIYNAVLPAINTLMNALSKLTGTIAMFVSGLFGTSLKNAKKQAQGLSKALDDTSKNGDKASGSLASFDNLEVINDSSGGSSSGSGIDYSGDIQYSQKLLDILNSIKDFVVDNKELVIGVLSGITAGIIALKLGLGGVMSLGIGLALAGVVILIQGIINFMKDPSWDNFLTILQGIALVVAGIAVLMGGWTVALIAVGAAIVAYIIQNWDKVKGIFSSAKDWIYKVIIQPIINFFKNMGDSISLAWTKVKTAAITVWKVIWDTISGIINKIISGIESMINAIVRGLNKILTPLSKVGNSILSAVGIKGFSFSTLSTVKLPRLASGAVIPPRQEFAAILGDQKHGTNIETPLETMKQANREVLEEFMDKYSGLNTQEREIVLRNFTLIAQFGTQTFQKLVVDSVRLSEQEMGKQLFVS